MRFASGLRFNDAPGLRHVEKVGAGGMEQVSRAPVIAVRWAFQAVSTGGTDAPGSGQVADRRKE